MKKDLIYTIHLEPAEEGGYTVTVPALPAVITQGDTYAEAIAMAEDAIQTYIEYCIGRARGLPQAGPCAPA
ncbi:MAG: type II toxin-antitoxin system HicB family antitoxin [Candidatus Hydrogenedentes bacterium]|nr:type II toxin-antitoxin system HicB family antitoxin [Candidatus Hydrogenedentota bacterium]